MRTLSLLLLLLVVAFPGPGMSVEPASGEEEAESAPMELESYQLVLLVRPDDAPDLPEEEIREIQAAHLQHLTRMGREGHLVVAGPFGDQEDQTLRGMALYRVEDLETARRLAESDPAVEAGRLEVEVMTWYTQKDALAFPGVEKMSKDEGAEAEPDP